MEKASKIIVIYSPWGEKVIPGIMKSRPPFSKLPIQMSLENEEICRLHEIYSEMNYLQLIINPFSPVSSVEYFFRNRIKNRNDVLLFKGPTFFEQFIQQLYDKSNFQIIKEKLNVNNPSSNDQNSDEENKESEQIEIAENYSNFI